MAARDVHLVIPALPPTPSLAPPPTTSGIESVTGDVTGVANALIHVGINGSFSTGKVCISKNNAFVKVLMHLRLYLSFYMSAMLISKF